MEFTDASRQKTADKEKDSSSGSDATELPVASIAKDSKVMGGSSLSSWFVTQDETGDRESLSGDSASGVDEQSYDDEDVESDGVYLDESLYDEYYEGLKPEEVAPRFYDWKEVCPELQGLLDNFQVLVDEMRRCTTRWTPWPETNLYSKLDQNGDWKVVPFVHTFPAYDASRMSWVDPNVEKCPKTCELLKSIPGLRTALYSRLGPDTRLSTHRGWADLANHVLRIHLTLVAPSESEACGVWVEGAVQHHALKNFIVFDDSKLHMAFNNSTEEERIVLIFDILRPSDIPIGRAQGGHTDQLDEFIQHYQASLGL